ncbi:hypothetical protein BG000_003693 [Podila horticola]|nr:hypothetical protein BG000_003693 [Podila horticola]
MRPATPKKKLIVLCDGTWCGSETNTRSNIYLLAEMIGIDMTRQEPDKAAPIELGDSKPGVKACYFPGGGLGRTFLDYLFDGSTGNDIRIHCTETYKYIVKHYSEDYEIWMFGLSRGAYTVRCVAGMINNCGIIKRKREGAHLNDATIDGLCDEVYKIYRSPYPEDAPKSGHILEFKKKASHNVATPIKFMGLLDTVGSLGIPKFDGGVGLHYPEFYDHKISSEVEKVYHACAIHDRLWAFEPCRALRDTESQKDRPELEIHEQVIEPNHVLADLVLKWILESIKAQDPEGKVICDIDAKITQLITNMTADKPKTGTGDVYDTILKYGPTGKVHENLVAAINTIMSFLDKLAPDSHPGTAIQGISGVKFIVKALTATRDRRIPNSNALLTLYDCGSPELGDKTIEKLGDVERYQSKTFQNFKAYLTAMGRQMALESKSD